MTVVILFPACFLERLIDFTYGMFYHRILMVHGVVALCCTCVCVSVVCR